VFVVLVACVTPNHNAVVVNVESNDAEIPPTTPAAVDGPPPASVAECDHSNEPTAMLAVELGPRISTNPCVCHCEAVSEFAGVNAPDTAPNNGDAFVGAGPIRCASVYVPADAAVVEVPDATRRYSLLEGTSCSIGV
jgi:hypothetical protein